MLGPIMPVGASGGGIPVPLVYTMGAAQTRTMSQAIGLGYSQFDPAQGVFKISGDKYGLTTQWYNSLTEQIFTQMTFDSSGDITWGTDQNWYSTGQPVGVAGASHDGNRVIFSGATNTTMPQQRYHTSFDLSAAGVLSNEVENGYTYNVFARDDNPHSLISLGDAFFIDYGGMTATDNQFKASLYRVSDMASQTAYLSSNLPDGSGGKPGLAVNSDRSDNDSGTALGFFNANATTQMSWFTLDYTSNTWGSIALTYRAGSYTAVSLPVEFTSSNTDNTVKYLGNDLFIYFATGSIGMARWDGTTFKELGHLALNWRYHGGMVNGAIISVTATEVHGFVTSGNTSPGALQTELYAKPFVLFLNDDDQITGFLGVEHHLTDGLTGNFSMPHVIVPETANATATFIFLDGNVASSVAFRKLTQA